VRPLPSTGSERRAEIRGRAKLNSLLEGQEAVCAEVVAGGRFGWWANHSPSASCSRWHHPPAVPRNRSCAAGGERGRALRWSMP
jgi:hypothetical protein